MHFKLFAFVVFGMVLPPHIPYYGCYTFSFGPRKNTSKLHRSNWNTLGKNR